MSKKRSKPWARKHSDKKRGEEARHEIHALGFEARRDDFEDDFVEERFFGEEFHRWRDEYDIDEDDELEILEQARLREGRWGSRALNTRWVDYEA